MAELVDAQGLGPCAERRGGSSPSGCTNKIKNTMEKTLCNTAPTTLMTLDEAIQHCIEKSEGCTQCAKEHQQLRFWLEELKFLRAWYRKWYAPINNVVQVDLSKIGNNTIEKAAAFCKDAIKD